MPSKNYNGQNPLGEKRSQSFAQVEQQVGRLQPAISLQSGSLQTPNGRILSQKMRPATTSTAACVPWKPRIVDERAEGAQNPDYKLYLNPGTVNGILSATWDDPVDFPTPLEEDPPATFIVLNLSFTQDGLNAITYSVEASIPSAGDLDPVGRNVLPSSLKIIIGTLVGFESCMIHDKNLLVSTVDIFHERLTDIPIGEQPFYVWYKYQTQSAN